MCPWTLHSFDNIHLFSKTILLSIWIMNINFIKFYLNNYVKTDLEEFCSIGCNVLWYFCVSLYTCYLDNVQPKATQLISHLSQTLSEIDNFCSHYHIMHTQTGIQTPKTFQVWCRISLTFQQLFMDIINRTGIASL